MPKELATLLIEEGAVPPDAIERALARQREAGGALDTALLEQRAIGEQALLVYLARAAELPAAPETAWTATDVRARRVFPSRVAERHGLAPFALDGRELSLVATYPVDLGLLDEISFMLSLHLTAHVGPEWRVRALIHRLYGSPLSPRLAILASAAGVAPAAEIPAEGGGAPTSSAPPSLVHFMLGGSEPLEPLAAALAEALNNVESFAFEDSEEDGDEAAPPDEDHKPGPPDRTAPPHWSLDDARSALAAARDRDAVVLVALRYARDFFEFAAMFAVTRDAVAGHDALGSDEARERARAVAIWSTDPGIFKTVIETRSPYLGPVTPGAEGTDAVLHALGREPRTVLAYPILLRDRPVCILYADNGEAPVSPRRLSDLLLFLSGVGASFERIIRDRKKRRRTEPAEPPASVAESLASFEAQFAGAPEQAAIEPAAPTAAPSPAAPPAATAAADPVSLSTLAERALDPELEVAATACATLGDRRRDPGIHAASETLRRALLSGVSGRAARAARAIGAIRDSDAIPLLIQVLEMSEPGTSQAAADALSRITLQRLGPGARPWLAWWKENRGRGRAEWLFSGLTSSDRETRIMAVAELSLAASPPVAYSVDMPSSEREQAARAWAGWWARSGHVL